MPDRPEDPRDEPALTESDYADRFADIVANWHHDPGHRRDPNAPPFEPVEQHLEPGEQGSGATPDRPRDDATDDPTGPLAADADPPSSASWRESDRSVSAVFGQGAEQPGWRSYSPPEEPDEDFVPPPPRPLPAGDLGFWGALIGLIGGPLWLVYIAVTSGPRLYAGLAIALSVAGFAILVARLPKREQRDEDDDDGAIV
ncbi:hypothetical protein BJY21_000212 [Kineosphaera limosa]|uniref:Uncharacterized protein n=1 Tax=Kineosphaera limosa NBRC 100340 TaxID=1184609 RepID=K6VL50_9MICO|nr:hypothetical protein [Kineosphaera limosa]NYD99027.1 hypothetical protein [Kineosphaera limosa]GAB96938.1 hypothetical protein KILIM_052_00360 [Kineosphaera limosa NBRC 100340]